MQPVQTAATSAKLDAASTTPLEVLMDRAGLAVALEASAMGVSYGDRVVVLAGSGNNGGDGYVAAHHLARRGIDVTVHAFAPPSGEVSRWAADRAKRSGARIRPWSDDPVGGDLLIDALFGCGFHGRLHDRIVPWTMTAMPVLAVDIASGVDASNGEVAGPAFGATRTVTFHALKVGHLVGRGAELTGSVSVADIGLDGGEAEFFVAGPEDADRPARPRRGHKWSVGSVMVVGGSIGMTGASALAADAALGWGAGAVAIAVNRANAPDYATRAGILRPVIGAGDRWQIDDVPRLLEAAARFDVLVVGPGLDPADEVIRPLLERRAGRIVLDAGGLRIPGIIDVLFRRAGETIVTPHDGEFRAMTGEPGTYGSAARLAKETGATVLLKGSPTFVAGGAGDGRVVAVTTPGPELATIGTGDVLSGMIASSWAAGLDAPGAAVSAAYWHGMAGAKLATRRTVTAVGLSGEVGRFRW